MAEKRNETKIGLSQNWLGANSPRYFTKYTLLAVPFLLWKLVKLFLWLLLAFCIIESFQWIFDYPFQRSHEHTSELQSLMRISYAVSCLTKKNTQQENNT